MASVVGMQDEATDLGGATEFEIQLQGLVQKMSTDGRRIFLDFTDLKIDRRTLERPVLSDDHARPDRSVRLDVSQDKDVFSGGWILDLLTETIAAVPDDLLQALAIRRQIQRVQTGGQLLEVIEITWPNFTKQKHRRLKLRRDESLNHGISSVYHLL